MIKTSILFVFLTVLQLVNANTKPSVFLKQDLIKNYALLVEEVNQLQRATLVEKIDWEALTQVFFDSRNAYKNVELLVAFLDPEFINDYINGAPLLKIERKTDDMTILNPKGFQIAEEVLFEKNLPEFKLLVEQLQARIIEFGNRLPSLYLSERIVFEAMRTQVIRITALGITGFDSPSGFNSLVENNITLKNLEKTASAYYGFLNENEQVKLKTIFKQGHSFFEVKEMDAFNRYQFIKQFLNPIYGIILQVQKELFIETKTMVVKSGYAVNYETENIFDTDFFNADYFANYANSGIEEKKIALGKTLFYDPIISKNNKRACASCHHPEKGFTDGLKTSVAFNEIGHIDRNSPTLINAIFSTRFFWDNRAGSPEAQAEHVIFNPKELNTNYNEILGKLNSNSTYKKLFQEAYPEIKEINRQTTLSSLSAFIQSLKSFNSVFDQSIKGKIPVPKDVEAGFNLFTGKAACATCHFIPTFSGLVPPLYVETESEVLGVPAYNDINKAILDQDLGRYGNGRPKEKADFYKNSFKTATIRNIELTAPYMHNGVFNTLEEVVEFYNIGGGHGWGIAPENTTLPSDELNLNATEIKQLIIFMQSLTDTTGMTAVPTTLPTYKDDLLKDRKIGGVY
ncbi:cytochrome-c peroxidase [Putridiphycobacter roseus]|nr:cytochrome c peroxidase [Putridiphycobacter roseus]